MPNKSYKELYGKALLLIECFSRRYEESHSKEDWDVILNNTDSKEFSDYIDELKGEEELEKD